MERRFPMAEDAVRMLLRLATAMEPRGIRVTLPASASEKLGHLASGGRDLLAPSTTLDQEVAQAMDRGLQAVVQGAAPDTPWQRAGEAVLRRLRLRVTQGGADLTLRALDPATIRRKGHARVGYETGALLRDLSRARVTLQRGRR